MQILFFERPLEERQKIWNQVKVDKAFRLFYFDTDFYAFAIYYFGHNFITGVKDFHKEIYRFCVDGRNALIIGFRESGKTAIVALIYIIYCIATEKESFILFMAYDLDSARDKVINVANFLRANKRFKADYGLLYDDLSTGKEKKANFWEQKTMSKFITTNGIKIEAVSLKQMKRGKQLLDSEGNIIRPSLLIADDIDIDESVRNIRIINENEKKINGGVFNSIRGRVIFLGNIIVADGIVQRLEKTYKNYWNIMRISLIEKGKIIWPEKYVWTQSEANQINQEKFFGEKIVRSIEELSIDTNIFDSDFLNLPKIIIGDPVFDTEKIDNCKELDPFISYQIKVEDREVELKIFYNDYKKDYYDYLYAGVDIGGGQGGDSDYTTLTFLDKNGNLYATIRSNEINYSHVRQILTILYSDYGFNFFDNSLGIEKNFTGVACIEDIRKYDAIIFDKLYIPSTEGKKIERYTNIVGWNTSGTSKEKLKEDLRKAIIQEKIAFEAQEKQEFKFWVKSEDNGKLVYEPDGINCKHDDTIISRGIAFQMFLNNNPNFLHYEEQ